MTIRIRLVFFSYLAAIVRQDACPNTLRESGFCRVFMTLIRIYRKYCDKWWALPLFLPSLLLPILRKADTFAQVEGGTVILYYLPLALMMSFTLFYGWKVLPGMVFALWLHFYGRLPTSEVIIIICHFIMRT